MKTSELKIGMSSCFARSIEREVFEAYAKNRIDMMEISLAPEKYPEINWKETKKHSEETGVKIWSLHLPFYPEETFNIASKNSENRKNTIKLQDEYIKKAADIGIKVMVIHPSSEPNEDNERAELINIAKDSLAQLAEVAGQSGAVIAVEDLPRTCLGNCSADIAELISADDRLRVCFDTNHLLIEKNTDFIKAFGEKIITLHVSDYDFLNERHWLPYEGKNNWTEILAELEKVGYSDPFMYEVGSTAPKTITRPAPLTYSDVYNNYIACINNKIPEIIGTPDEAICLDWAYFKTPQI